MARTKGRKANPEGRMALKDHVRELRNRLIISGIAVLLGAVGGWFLYDPVMVAVQQPLMEISAQQGRRAEINYGSVGSPFDLKIQVSIFLGLLVSSPVWIYQIWAFITPGLKGRNGATRSASCSPQCRCSCWGSTSAGLCCPRSSRS
jgi:sec-independent protein translocase protein TatC